MDKPTEIVRKAYNEIGVSYDQWARSIRTEERKKYLNVICDLFPPEAAILDVGCGTGLLTTRRLAERFEVTGIDISERQIAEAKKHVRDATFICADVLAYDFDPKSFDGIVSFYCLNHIPRESYSLVFAKFNTWLKSDGRIVMSFGIGNERAWIGSWLGSTTFFSSYDRRTTLSLIEEAGFMIEQDHVEIGMEDGRKIAFLWVIAKKM